MELKKTKTKQNWRFADTENKVCLPDSVLLETVFGHWDKRYVDLSFEGLTSASERLC